jgi:hypothetical protein
MTARRETIGAPVGTGPSKRSRRRWPWALLVLGLVASLAAWPTSVQAQSTLSDREAIMELKAEFLRSVDQKDWVVVRGLLADGVMVDFSVDGEGTFSDADSFVAALQQNAVTVHQGHMPEINVSSPTYATGVWAIEDLRQVPNGSGGFLERHGYGHHFDSYTKDSGEWKIASITLSRLRVDAG